MLDQSFSHENFRVIMDVENRKGIYLEDKGFFESSDLFKKSREITDQIIVVNNQISIERVSLKKIVNPKPEDYQEYNNLIAAKEELKQNREIELKLILTELSQKTNSEDYQIKIKKGQIKFGSQLYVAENEPEHYFVLKQLQRNIYKTFKVKQSDRREILTQLKTFLEDDFPKYVVRTDIKSFYESIPHKYLLSKIEENSLLSYPSKRIIKDILNQYWKILLSEGVKKESDERIGIPRGIGISAYLSELYLRDFDRKISSQKNVSFYARYVDDIIFVITPKLKSETVSSTEIKIELSKLLSSTSYLQINNKKTTVIDLCLNSSKLEQFVYLGYKFSIGYRNEVVAGTDVLNKVPLEITMSNDKFNRYKTKVKLAFESYSNEFVKYPGRHSSINRKLLIRIKFLTNNFQLFRRKQNVLVGIFFSNEFINKYEDLIKLDTYLKRQITSVSPTIHPNLLLKLNSLSFKDGFHKKRFLKFNYKSFESGKVLEIWKNI